jgi:cobalamin biosynthesis protein CobT
MTLKPIAENYVRQGSVIMNAVVQQDGWKINTVAPGTTPSCNLVTKTLNVTAFGPALTAKQENRIRANHIHECGHAVLSELDRCDALVHDITNALEDLRIEAALGYTWAGAGPSLQEDNAELAKEIGAIIEAGKWGAGPLREALTRLMFADQGITLAGTPSAKAQTYMDLIGAKFASWHTLPDRMTKDGAKHVITLAKEIADMLREAKKEEQQEKPEPKQDKAGKGEKGDKGEKGEGKPEAGKGKPGKDEDDAAPAPDGDSELDGDEDNGKPEAGDDDDDADEGAGKGDAGDEDEDADTDGSAGADGDEDGDDADDDEGKSGKDGSKPGSKGQDTDDEVAPKSDPKAVESALIADLSGDDVSTIRQETAAEAAANSTDGDPDRYVSDTSQDVWTTPGTDDVEYQKSKVETAAVVGKLQRTLEQALIADTRARVTRNLEDGNLDLQALHHICKGTSKAVFSRTTPGQKLNTAVVITMDESGSMGSDKSAAMRSFAIALGESLDRIGIPFEIIGASTAGHRSLEAGIDRMNPILHLVYKTFTDRWGAVRTRLGTIRARANNVDGEFILNAGKRLLARREHRKVLISLSDGLPMAGHGNEIKMRRNLVRSCQTLRKNGIEVYGFGMLTSDPKQYYGSKWFVYAPTIANMGTQFFKECVGIIKGRGKGVETV